MNMWLTTTMGVLVSCMLLASCETCAPATKFAVLGDIFTVNFSTCDGCCPAGNQLVINATIREGMQEKPLPYDRFNGRFWVTFTPENTTRGSTWYTLSYTYVCIIKHITCQQEIFLQLRIADFSLKLVDQPVVGDDIELLSSSGLSTNNITVRFEYSTEDFGKKRVATCEPNMTEPKIIGNWKIFRLNSIPFNCRLVILNATTEDSGYYESVGLLPNGDGDGDYEYASSNIVELRVGVKESTLGPAIPKASGSSKTYIFIAAMIATLVGILIAVVVIVTLVRRKRRQNPHPYRHLPGPQYARAGRQPPIPAYGAAGGGIPVVGERGERRRWWGVERGRGRRRGGEESPGNISPDLSISVDDSTLQPSFYAPNTGNDGSADHQVPPHSGGGGRSSTECITPVAGSSGGGVMSEEDRFTDTPTSIATVIPGRGLLSPHVPSDVHDSSEESGEEPEQPADHPGHINPPQLRDVIPNPGLDGPFFNGEEWRGLDISHTSLSSDVSSMSMFSEPSRASSENLDRSRSSSDQSSRATGQGSRSESRQSLTDDVLLVGTPSSVATGVPISPSPPASLEASSASDTSLATGVPSETSSNGSNGSNGNNSPVN